MSTNSTDFKEPKQPLRVKRTTPFRVYESPQKGQNYHRRKQYRQTSSNQKQNLDQTSKPPSIQPKQTNGDSAATHLTTATEPTPSKIQFWSKFNVLEIGICISLLVVH